jgi:hypothetical protein
MQPIAEIFQKSYFSGVIGLWQRLFLKTSYPKFIAFTWIKYASSFSKEYRMKNIAYTIRWLLMEVL